jgi:hypothetical protein
MVELERWYEKVNKAGKMVTWHAVEISDEMYKAIKAGTMTFEQAREQLARHDDVDSIKALAKSIDNAVAKYEPA